jgi:hypothetical protein
MSPTLEDDFARARAFAHALKAVLDSAADIDDCARTVGAAVFLASELEEQLQRVENGLAPPAESDAQLAGRLDITVEALEFYANADNYEARSGRVSAILKDKGLTARNALAAIDPDSDSDSDDD